jgi:hypothetical protein
MSNDREKKLNKILKEISNCFGQDILLNSSFRAIVKELQPD